MNSTSSIKQYRKIQKSKLWVLTIQHSISYRKWRTLISNAPYWTPFSSCHFINIYFWIDIYPIQKERLFYIRPKTSQWNVVWFYCVVVFVDVVNGCWVECIIVARFYIIIPFSIYMCLYLIKIFCVHVW